MVHGYGDGAYFCALNCVNGPYPCRYPGAGLRCLGDLAPPLLRREAVWRLNVLPDSSDRILTYIKMPLPV